jgi:hypothetical protein
MMPSNQIKLWDLPKCHVCGKPLMPIKGNKIDGFYDADTGECCHHAATSPACYHEHYKVKQGNAPGVTFSEMPIQVFLIRMKYDTHKTTK